MADAHIALCLQFVSHPHQIYQRFGFHLMHEVSAMNFYRKLADSKFGGDLFVQTAFNDFKHDLTFARRQQRKSSSDFQQDRLCLSPHPILVNSNMNCVYQILMTKRLRQKIDRASLDGPNRHQDVAVPGNKNNREIDFGFCQFVLAVQSIEAGKPHIQNEASRGIRSSEMQEFFRRTECQNIQLDRTNKTVQSLSYGGIVINDEHKGFVFFHDYAPARKLEILIQVLIVSSADNPLQSTRFGEKASRQFLKFCVRLPRTL